MQSVLLLSGGLDSAVLLGKLTGEGAKPSLCLTFDYGQSHRKEIESAKVVASHYQTNWRLINLPPEVFAGSSLTGRSGVMFGTPTVVPGRNLIFLSLGVAEVVKLVGPSTNEEAVVYFAPNKGDDAIYPDCRKGFVSGLSFATWAGYGVKVEAPLIDMTKAEILSVGRKLKVPIHLTWSCYSGGDVPCGGCGACMERAKAEVESEVI